MHVGRVKDVVALSVVGPDGQTQPTRAPSSDRSIRLNGRGDIYYLDLSIRSCGPKREWLIEQAKPAKRAGRRAGGGRSSKR